jgi:hypothetical protein
MNDTTGHGIWSHHHPGVKDDGCNLETTDNGTNWVIVLNRSNAQTFRDQLRYR